MTLFFVPFQILINLGAERVIVPATPNGKQFWTQYFGFSEMTDSERLQLRDYNFLGFSGSIFLQKLAMNTAESGLSFTLCFFA